MFVEPDKADPDDVARKRAAAPDLRMPPEPTYTLDENGELISYKMQN
ncbi:MAG: hypothetical protein QOC63_5190, partial [Mycobacterium sp.]|nr:hypothetical protein [Mycobacterium sp.]